MEALFMKYWKYLAFGVAGAVIGFAYWRFVGCTTGNCPMTANWHTSVMFGSVIGLLAVPSRKKEDKQSKEEGTDEK